MMNTVANTYSFSSVGLHTGNNCTVILYPSNSGVISINNVPVSIYNVVETAYYTQLGDVKTVEHLLAFLFVNKIDSCDIRVFGGEVPILDGSCRDYASIVETSKIDLHPEYLSLPSFESQYKHSYICITPSDDFSVSVFYGNTSVNKFNPNARTFVNENQIASLREAGLIKGGSLNNALVLGRHTKAFRMENEPAYHKLLDVYGDLALFGKRLKGSIFIENPSHDTTRYFVREVLAS